MKKLLTPFNEKGFTLKNHLVMAPMTRCRAIGNIPNDLMATYYGQRSGAGLIVTEGTSPAPEGLGYSRIPGIFSAEQVEGWKKTTEAVHKENSKIFLQIMHTGRVSHNLNMPEGYYAVGPSDIKPAGQMYSDAGGMQDFSDTHALTTEETKQVITSYVTAAENAVAAGFDGVEIHSANGYLPEQFLNPHVNTRTDEYGGRVEGRAAFVLEIAKKTADAIGKEKTGIRISPYSTFNDMTAYAAEEVDATYTYLAKELEKTGVAYIHINLGAPVPQHTLQAIRAAYTGVIILCGGLEPATAEDAITNGVADLAAFGRHYLANPDLDIRIEKDAALQAPDMNTFYTADAVGYTDYPTL